MTFVDKVRGGKKATALILCSQNVLPSFTIILRYFPQQPRDSLRPKSLCNYIISSSESLTLTCRLINGIQFRLFYLVDKIKKRYGNLGTVLCHTIDRGANANIGISLAGHRDRNKMACFIAGINPKGIASSKSGLEIGDEILEVRLCNTRHSSN